MATPEKAVKKMVREKLKELGVWQYWPVSNGMGMHGVPDCLFCYRGKFFAIETKAPGKRNQARRGCTALQAVQMQKIQEVGGWAWVVDGVEDMDEILLIIGDL